MRGQRLPGPDRTGSLAGCDRRLVGLHRSPLTVRYPLWYRGVTRCFGKLADMGSLTFATDVGQARPALACPVGEWEAVEHPGIWGLGLGLQSVRPSSVTALGGSRLYRAGVPCTVLRSAGGQRRSAKITPPQSTWSP